MPSETDAKTRLGLSQALTKANQIHGTLGAIDPDSDNPDATAALRRARGLAAALVVAVQHFETVCYDLWQARPPRQLSLEDLLSSARKLVPSLRDEENEAVRSAAELEPEEDEEEDDEDDEPGADETSAANARGFFGKEPPTSEDVAEHSRLVLEANEALEAAGYTRPTVVLDRWSDDELRTAIAWATTEDKGASLPVPDKVAEPCLESLDLEADDDLSTLLEWLDLPDASETDWTVAERNAIVEWATGAHQRDRGEEDVEVPPLPDILMPDASSFEPARRAVASAGGEATRAEVLRVLQQRDIAVVFALDALIAAGEIEVAGDGKLVLPEVAVDTPDDELLAGAKALAERRPWPVDEEDEVDVDAEVEIEAEVEVEAVEETIP
ncbi:MAG TPA: hypothetical protein DCY40_07565 [Actinobacteria bacterium]|nr:hypothetical protein [Actinomycetota bacterium]